MSKKRNRTYSADDLRAIEERLSGHTLVLTEDIQDRIEIFSDTQDSNIAVEIRDLSQKLCVTMACRRAIETSIQLADLGREVSSVPFLDETGLEVA